MLQQKFRKSPPIMANYSYQDIESGTGMVNFYGIKMSLYGPAITYHLIEETYDAASYCISSAKADEEPNCASTAYPSGTITFDTDIFNRPRIINGTPFVVIPVALVDNGSNASITIQGVRIYIVHSDDSTTLISNSIDFPQLTQTVANAFDNKPLFARFNKISNQLVKEGEKLRLSLDASGTSSPADNYLLHNPAGSSVVLNDNNNTAARTQLVITFPFKMDI
jgi:hypothetical protein